MRTSRYNTFETNSSSCHALVTKKDLPKYKVSANRTESYKGKLILTNGHIFILSNKSFIKMKVNSRWRILNEKHPEYSQPCGFYFTRPAGTKYYELLKQFVNPMTLSQAKANVGIVTTHWASFTQAAIAFNLLEKIPHSCKYQLTKDGRKYVKEVDAGYYYFDRIYYKFYKGGNL